MGGESSDPIPEVAPIPFRLRVGITGHRHLDPSQRPAITDAIRAVLEALPRAVLGDTIRADTPVLLTMISPLAEGADRLAAEAAMAIDGSRIECPMPFPQAEYERDFTDPESLDEFRRLLPPAEWRVELGERSDGYRSVGWFIADRADVLIAVWNGIDRHKEGGTADIVRRALRTAVPVVWIPATAIEDGVPAVADPAATPARWCDLAEWRAAPTAGGERFVAELFRDAADQLREEYEKTRALNERVRHVPAEDDPFAPFEEAADSLANGFQADYRRAVKYTFLFAALAAAAIALQTVFQSEGWVDPVPLGDTEVSIPWLGAIEVLALAGIVSTFRRARRDGRHEGYIAYRFLAERLRAAPHLAAVGADAWDIRPSLHKADVMVYRTESWPWRAFDEIWPRRAAPVPDGDTESIVRVANRIADAWIRDRRTDFSDTDGLGPRFGSADYRVRAHALKRFTPRETSQYGYHQRAAGDDLQVQRWLTVSVRWLFGLTLVAAAVHLFFEAFALEGADHPGIGVTNAVLLLSIVLAACGAALSGYVAQRGHHRQATRSRRMMIFLAVDDERVRKSITMRQLKARVEETHAHMLAENRLWFESLSYEEVELHS